MAFLSFCVPALRASVVLRDMGWSRKGAPEVQGNMSRSQRCLDHPKVIFSLGSPSDDDRSGTTAYGLIKQVFTSASKALSKLGQLLGNLARPC